MTEKRICSIYCFINLINGKQYIGSTIQPINIRYNQHIYNVTHKNTHQYNYPLYCAIRKYGIENFQFKVLLEKECTEQEIRILEKQYIEINKTIAPFGYNQTSETEHPINAIDSYKKMSETKRENSKKVALIDENNNIISIYRSIKDCSEELNIDERKIGSCCRGERHTTNNKRFYWIDENNNLIIPQYKKNLYKGQKGTTQIQKTSRKVAKINKDTDKILETYNTIALAARENDCDPSGISKVCNGKRKICGGFKWSYVDKSK